MSARLSSSFGIRVRTRVQSCLAVLSLTYSSDRMMRAAGHILILGLHLEKKAMKRKALATFLFIAATTATGSPLAQSAETLYARAIEQHRAGRWSSAYGLFIRAANAGDPRAARIALFLHRHGNLLYRASWDLSLDETVDWHDALKRHAAPTGSPQAAGTHPVRTH